MNIKNIENEMKEKNSKSPEINQNSEIKTTDSDISNKLTFCEFEYSKLPSSNFCNCIRDSGITILFFILPSIS